ncbi:MAG: cation:proton antiporter [Planctomycetes bacterium]|nr:cation:proton antiporter [Planctomycetota bacterium]MBI3843736.1 cation:proton antiporter [Planctomycetota bacterium]
MGGPDVVPKILVGLAAVLLLAKLGGEFFERIGQPAVLGVLLAGIVVGNAHVAGIASFDFLRDDATFTILAELGVVILLFEVGLNSNVTEMLGVGPMASVVALVGVIVPSILGAAVIDDVLGLVTLAAVTGMIAAAESGRSIGAGGIGVIVGKSVCLLVVSIVVGLWLSPRLFRLSTFLRSKGLLLTTRLSFCFLLAFAAQAFGLAPIVGSFTAGLILEEIHYRELARRDAWNLHQALQPISALLVPIFFILMGLRVDVRMFADPTVLGFAGVLTVAAVAGKQACSAVVWERGLDRVLVGIGMIPRSEVGLIFAGIGATLILGGGAVVTPPIFSAAVILVIVTTLLLKWRLAARRSVSR